MREGYVDLLATHMAETSRHAQAGRLLARGNQPTLKNQVVDRGGCGNPRVRQPLAMIKAHTKHDTHIIDMKDDDIKEVSKALSFTGFVFLQPDSY